jgi:heme/copper-type cytochrome/quinol oxidase subunit 3
VALALPAAPAPARTRSQLVATAFACAAGLMFFGGLLALYAKYRHLAGGTTATWVPKKVRIPEIPSNTMLITMMLASITAQWAVYAMRRGNRRDTSIALAITGLFGVAVINAQAFIYSQMKMPIRNAEGKAFNVLFYTTTGAFMFAVIIGLGLAAVTAFRSLGGRFSPTETEGVSSVALYWHFLTVAFAGVWLFVYVTK